MVRIPVKNIVSLQSDICRFVIPNTLTLDKFPNSFYHIDHIGQYDSYRRAYMLKTISAMQARQSLGRVMNEVAIKGDDYIIERDGKPIVAVVSLDKFGVIQKERGEAQQLLNEIRQKMAGTDNQQLEGLIGEAIKNTRGR